MSSYAYLFKLIVIGDTSTFGGSRRRREELHAPPVPREEVQVRPRYHHRRRVRLQDRRGRGQTHQAADLGHSTPLPSLGRTGDLQVHHSFLLPRLHRSGARLRHQQPRLFQQHFQMARRNQGLRQRQSHCLSHRQQIRSRKQVRTFLQQTRSQLRRRLQLSQKERNAFHGVFG